jgi:hypothetical protein
VKIQAFLHALQIIAVTLKHILHLHKKRTLEIGFREL